MQYQQLGKTGIFVSRLCLGTMTFGSGTQSFWQHIGNSSQRDANKIVDRALEAGINFFDTANVYQIGESETILGKALGSRRKDVVLATKVHGRMGSGANQVGQSRLHIMQAVEDSLRRLGTDYIDLYQVHNQDIITPYEETLKTFDNLISQGKIRYIGCSNLTAWQIMKALGISEKRGWESYVSIQPYYSLVGREIEREIVPLAKDQKLGIITWSPLAGGLLTGKFMRDQEPSDKHARRRFFDFPPVDLEHAYKVIDVLKVVADRHNSSIAQVALAWQLHQSFVTSVIIGARNLEQLEDNLKSESLVLSAKDLNELDSVSRLSVEYPLWMESLNADRIPIQKPVEIS